MSKAGYDGISTAGVARKGLPEILDALASIERSDVRLVICGSGSAPSELRELLTRFEFCELHENLADNELAVQFANADVFVLATRLQRRPVRAGEGFGLVLAEAQLAGTPVVAPAFGGCTDAYRQGVTGVAPVDQSSAALESVLRWMLDDSERLKRMSEQAREWATAEFEPGNYAGQARAILL